MDDKAKILRLANHWEERLLDAQIGHYIQSERLSSIANLIGGGIILLTVLITMFTFYDAGENQVYLEWGIAITSASAAMLSAIQTFYKPNERAEIHRAQAARYGAMKRKIELASIESEESILGLYAILTSVEKEWEGTAIDSPLTKFNIITKIEQKKREIKDAKALTAKR